MKMGFKVLTILIIIGLIWPFSGHAEERAYPKLANYFLKWTIENYEVEELAKWDLLILDMDTQENSRRNLQKIRELNPDVIMLAYLGSQEANANIYQSPWAQYGTLKKRIIDNTSDNWWLKDKDGNRISFWPGNYLFNVSDGCGTSASGQRWNDFLPEFVTNEILSTGLWDGVFYDSLWGDVTWSKNVDMDINNDKNIKSKAEINRLWAEGMKEILDKTRKLNSQNPNLIIVGNANVFFGYQTYVNGMMFESFPSSWENGGTWAGSMETYAKLAAYNKKPQVTILNSFAKDRRNFAKVRFGLASALLQDHGYFSYDFDVTNHGQLWWYDEYDVNLGKPVFPAYNILDKGNDKYKPGLWRRDFANGVVVVNTTKEAQKYIFSREEFEKINGQQDRSMNDGSKINWIKLNPNDGVVLLKRNTEIINNSFYNGSFVRVYNPEGVQVRNGFFSYLDNFSGNAQVLIADLDNDKTREYLSNNKGLVSVYKDGKKIKSFNPYNSKFKGEISVATADLDNNGIYEIITGAGNGGGPQVQVLSKDGKVVGTFFAYDKKFRGGVNVAGGNIGGDAQKEIVTGPGAGMEPEIRIYSPSGKLYNQFMAYDKRFRGGVNVAIGDVNGDGENEIITGAGAGGGPEVRVFDKNGKLLKKFMAYDKTVKTGVKVITEDINDDGVDEILASTISF